MSPGERARLGELGADLGAEVRFEVPLRELTTWRIGGPAEALVAAGTQAAVQATVALASESGWPLRVLGNGSNLLCPDEGVRGVVLTLTNKLSAATWDGARLRVEAGAFLPKLAREAAVRGWSGLEPVVGVPGTVGGGCVLNAGTPAGTLGDVLTSVDVLQRDGTLHTLAHDELALDHRSSRLQHESWIVLAAELALRPDEPAAIEQRLAEHLAYRKRTQPLSEASCGSVFRRPPGDYPGRLIEAAGGKGLRRGDAEVSPLHANWIINRGQATAADVKALMAELQERVARLFQVELVPEVIVWEP